MNISIQVLYFIITLVLEVRCVINPVEIWSERGLTETGWYSSPAYVRTSSGDGLVIGSAYSVYAINVMTGEVKWKVRHSGADRTWPGIIVVHDFIEKGDQIVLTGHGNGWVCAWVAENGEKKWCTQVASTEVRGLAVGKLDSSLGYNVFAGIAVSANSNLLRILSPQGQVIDTRPRTTTDGYPDGWCWYQCNANIALADLNNDGNQEVIQPCDTHYITAYNHNLDPLPANSKFDASGEHKIWGRVGFNQYEAVDLRGYGHDGLRPNFCHGAATTFKLPSGERLLTVSGNYHIIGTDPLQNVRHTVFVVRGDRSRYVDASKNYNWTYTPDNSPFLEEKYAVIESVMPNIAAVDLDGDGYVELIYPNNDGYMHCNWLNKTEMHSWPFKVTEASTMRFPSEVAVFRVPQSGDYAESDTLDRTFIAFSSWGQKDETHPGYIHFVNGKGIEVKKFTIPYSGTQKHNGALGAPTLFYHAEKSINLLLTVQTIYSGNVLIEIVNSNGSEILWQTGRGSYFRDGRVHEVGEDQNDYFGPGPFVDRDGRKVGGFTSGGEAFAVTFGVLSSIILGFIVIMVVIGMCCLVIFLAIFGVVFVVGLGGAFVGYYYLYEMPIKNNNSNVDKEVAMKDQSNVSADKPSSSMVAVERSNKNFPGKPSGPPRMMKPSGPPKNLTSAVVKRGRPPVPPSRGRGGI